MLESLSLQTITFHISTLFVVTTMVAVCFALVRVVAWLGILVFVITVLATLRTSLLVVRRRQHRYPIAFADVLPMFGYSVLGVVVALVVFGGLLFLSGIFLGILSQGLYGDSAVAVLTVIGLLSVVGAVTLVGQRPQNRPELAVGAIAAGFLSLTAAGVAWCVPLELAPLIAMSPPMIVALAALILACRADGCHRAKSLLVGYVAGVGLLVAASLLLLGSWWKNPFFAVVLGAPAGVSSVLIWPVLLGILTLEAMWSWDDAFPSVVRHPVHRPQIAGSATLVTPGCTDTEGIEFPADQPRDRDPPA